MILTLLIGVPLALLVAYGFWMAGELGLGPAWRRSRSNVRSGTEHEPPKLDSERRLGNAP